MKKNLGFILRREPYYHKIQYSKTPKFDPAAAIFGVTLGAFVAYLTLSSVGSGGTDLSDLTTLVGYVLLLLYTLKTGAFLQKSNKAGYLPGAFVGSSLFLEFFTMFISKKTPKKKHTHKRKL